MEINEKAVIYVRVSTLDQNTDRQISDLKAYAKKLDFIISEEHGIFKDTISGYNKRFDDRIDFNRMIEYIKNHNIEHILVSELSRISRQYIETVTFINDCSQKGINIHIQKENLSTLNPDKSVNVMTQMIVGLLSSIAAQESETLRFRIRSGKKNEALKGNSYHGKLFGYDKIDGKPVINDKEAEIVRKMYEMLLQGFGCRKIANYLNENNGLKIWSSASVHSVVTNPFFMGKRRFKDIYVDVDPIVSKEVFNDAQAFIQSRFRFVSDSKHVNPFASFIRCKCGATFTQIIIPSNRTNLYKCSATCGVPSVNRPYLIAEVKKSLELSVRLTQDTKERAKYNQTIKVNDSIISKNSQRLAYLEKMFEKNYDLFLNEKISETIFNKALLRFEDEKLKLNETNKKLTQNNKSITQTLKNEILYYSDDLEVFKKQILPILENIIIDEKHCTINVKGFSMMFFYIYRGHELQLYNNHLKKHGNASGFRPSLNIEGLDEETQRLVDHYLNPHKY